MPRFLEMITAAVLIIITLPLTLTALLISAVFIGFPPFYSSTRTGKNGEEYTHWKIKSMKKGREAGRVFFESSRMNFWGRLLRRLHLDELPELYLILTGRMSFAGPRPLPEKLLEGMDTEARETVRPGWTGPAQLLLMRKGKLNKRLQIKLDNHYVKRKSFCYDLSIITATLTGLFRSKPANLDPTGSPDRISFGKNMTNQK